MEYEQASGVHQGPSRCSSRRAPGSSVDMAGIIFGLDGWVGVEEDGA